MKLSDKMTAYRSVTPGEMVMDEFIQGVKRLETLAEELEERVAFLDALEAAGVDSWDGYDGAQELLEVWQQEGE